MNTIYVYVMNTLADWEIGYVTAELNSKRFFKKDAPEVMVKTVSYSKEPIQTMGGMTIVPDCTVDDIVVEENNVIILPGGDTWNDPHHEAVLRKASEFLAVNAMVCAICGATVALANMGLLNNRPHTSNGQGFLEMFCPAYTGTEFYVDEPAVTDHNLITAGSTGGVLWAKQIIESLGVFQENALEAWYNYFSTGEAQYFFALMQATQSLD